MIIQGNYEGVNFIPTPPVPMITNASAETIFMEGKVENNDDSFQNYLRNSIFDFWGSEREEREVNDLNEK